MPRPRLSRPIPGGASPIGGMPSRILFGEFEDGQDSATSVDQAHRIDNRWPVLIKEADRRRSILENAPGRFIIEANPNADGGTPVLAQHALGFQAVQKLGSIIGEEAARLGVDPDLVRAVMYVETAQGYYFGAGPLLDLLREMKAPDPIPKSKTVLPMNVNPDLWGPLAGADSNLHDPRTNIRAGTVLLKRILERLSNPRLEAVATLYNSLAKDRVTDYGARVADVYRRKLWQIPPYAYERMR